MSNSYFTAILAAVRSKRCCKCICLLCMTWFVLNRAHLEGEGCDVTTGRTHFCPPAPVERLNDLTVAIVTPKDYRAHHFQMLWRKRLSLRTSVSGGLLGWDLRSTWAFNQHRCELPVSLRRFRSPWNDQPSINKIRSLWHRSTITTTFPQPPQPPPPPHRTPSWDAGWLISAVLPQQQSSLQSSWLVAAHNGGHNECPGRFSHLDSSPTKAAWNVAHSSCMLPGCGQSSTRSGVKDQLTFPANPHWQFSSSN